MMVKDSNGIFLQIGDAVGYSNVNGYPFGIVKSLGPGGNVKVKFPGLPSPIGIKGRRLLKASGPICKDCAFPLKEIEWNSRVNLFICTNWKCSKYGQPQGRRKLKEVDNASNNNDNV